MITEIEYALMAGGAYISTRGPKNQFPIPPNWIQENAKVGTGGFEAVSYFNGGTNEVVISFAGTFPSDVSEGKMRRKMGSRRKMEKENGVRLGILHKDVD